MPNPYRQFLDLLPGDPLLIGEVLGAVNGLVQVQFLDGSMAFVRGTGTVGNKVFIKGGFIQGDAPNLPIIAIDV